VHGQTIVLNWLSSSHCGVDHLFQELKVQVQKLKRTDPNFPHDEILPRKGENQPHTVEPTDRRTWANQVSANILLLYLQRHDWRRLYASTDVWRLSQMNNFRPTSRRHDSKHCSHHLEPVTAWWFARNCSSWSSSADSSRKSVIVYVHCKQAITVQCYARTWTGSALVTVGLITCVRSWRFRFRSWSRYTCDWTRYTSGLNRVWTCSQLPRAFFLSFLSSFLTVPHFCLCSSSVVIIRLFCSNFNNFMVP